jgi:DNA-binding NtrC family response regulator
MSGPYYKAFGYSGYPVDLWGQLQWSRSELNIEPLKKTSMPMQHQSLVLLDAPKGFALGTLKKSLFKTTPILVLVQPGDVRTAVECMKHGAHDVIELDEENISHLAARVAIWIGDVTENPPTKLTSLTEVSTPTLELPVDGMNISSTLNELERDMLSKALEQASGDKVKAARMLGLNHTTFIEKLKMYDVS